MPSQADNQLQATATVPTTDDNLSREDRDLRRWIEAVGRQVRKVQSKGALPKRVGNSLLSIAHYRAELATALQQGDFRTEQFATAKQKLFSRADEMLVAMAEQSLEPDLVEELSWLHKVVSSHKSRAAKRASRPKATQPTGEFSNVVEIFRGQLATLQNESNRIRDLVADAQKSATATAQKINKMDEGLDDVLISAKRDAGSIHQQLLEKQSELNALVASIGGEAIAGDYASSAKSEGKLADSMRNAAVGLMLVIVCLIGVSLFETGRSHLDLETAVLRLLFSLALSVPAAYLARESTKHRDQQNLYRRIALDLRAVSPYLASLPPQEQHQLKSELANKIFGNYGNMGKAVDSYPLNLNELFTTLISRIDVKEEKKV